MLLLTLLVRLELELAVAAAEAEVRRGLRVLLLTAVVDEALPPDATADDGREDDGAASTSTDETGLPKSEDAGRGDARGRHEALTSGVDDAIEVFNAAAAAAAAAAALLLMPLCLGLKRPLLIEAEPEEALPLAAAALAMAADATAPVTGWLTVPGPDDDDAAATSGGLRRTLPTTALEPTPFDAAARPKPPLTPLALLLLPLRTRLDRPTASVAVACGEVKTALGGGAR